MRGPVTFYEDKGDVCNIRSEVAKTVLATFGLTRKCSFQEDTTQCFKNDVALTLSKASMRLMGIFSMDRTPIQMKTILIFDNGRSCFESEFSLLKI